MRKVRIVLSTLVVAAVGIASTACSPDAPAEIGRTFAALITWILWIAAHPAGSL